MNVQQNTKKGFTIIEVVLVLAIAALIFLMIFIALPALQRGQKNNARKNDVGVVVSGIGAYRTNNSGAMPAAGKSAKDNGFSKYVDKLSQADPEAIQFTDGSTAGTTQTSPAVNVDEVVVYTSAKCASNEKYVAAGKRSAAVFTKYETTGTAEEFFCQDA